MKKITLLALSIASIFNNATATKLKTPNNKMVKYGQCWVFSSLLSKDKNSVEGFNEINVVQSDKSSSVYTIVISLAKNKEDKAIPLATALETVEVSGVSNVTIVDGDGKRITAELKALYNKETGQMEFTYSTKKPSTGFEMYVEDIKFKITNTCKQSFDFEANRTWKKADNEFQAKVNQVGSDPCSNKFNIKTISYKGVPCDMTTDRGICLFNGQKTVTMSFGLDETNSIAASVEAEITVTDCKGSNKNLKLNAKLNIKTGLYEADFTVPATDACYFQLLRTLITVKNQCNETKLFSADMSEVARNADKTGWDIEAQVGEDYADKLKIEYLHLNGSGISISGGNIEIKDNSTISMRLATPPRFTKFGGAKVLLTLVDSKGAIYTFPANFDIQIKSGYYETNITIPANNGYARKIKNIEISIDVFGGSARIYYANLNSAQNGGPSGTTDEGIMIHDFGKAIDLCNVKYKLNDVNDDIQDKNGYLSLLFSMSFENGSDTPVIVNLMVELTNCKDEVKYIKLALKFDVKTGMWVTKESLLQDKECPMVITRFLLAATSPCSEKFYWDGKLNNEKTNKPKPSFNWGRGEGSRVFYHWGSVVSTSNP